MNIRDILDPGSVFLDLGASDAISAIDAVSENIGRSEGISPKIIARALLERESLGSTSVGNGFAIPHCKLTEIEEIIVALARFKDGIPFDADHDSQPVTFFFVVLSPPDQPAAHLQILSQIARILKQAELRNQLLVAETAQSIVHAIQKNAEVESL
jgi:mannitol/fructose-specific phosphotransferase system IIA component (Ntr-type)